LDFFFLIFILLVNEENKEFDDVSSVLPIVILKKVTSRWIQFNECSGLLGKEKIIFISLSLSLSLSLLSIFFSFLRKRHSSNIKENKVKNMK